ncbi:MAG: transglutaminase domain-containing protein, partial [Thermoplasmata archaeon]|nr:transglutaminase domain-containing protein [Thermoplasmata archaeon]
MGIVRTMTIEINSDYSGIFQTDVKYVLSGIIPMVNYTAPRTYRSPWTDPNYYGNNGFPDLMIGSGDGNIIHYGFTGRNERTLNYEKRNSMLSISNHKGPITPGMIDMDGDINQDIVLGTGDGTLPVYRDLGSIFYPYWKPMPSIPLFEIENYRSSFEDVLMVYNEEGVSRYLDSIIYPPYPKYRDEIGFSCAYTPPEQMRNNRLSDLFVQNARDIYRRAGDLDYVRIVEFSGIDHYTTTEYRVREGGNTRWMSIPRDEYYWGVVHPRVTEETVSYIDPETGGERAREDGGRFWREYLWEHADSEYPPGPDYPDDWTGRVAYYPRNSTPPLLKEVLADVDILWDLMPYEYPGGFDNNGENNNHPWDLRDHAIEKVSHWVEKTLVLNQQEVTDGERPTQPVRIAHHHNGNCGELQDLTIAAARSALIPARGVMLTGEDHVWSEFYLGGWHQWDNYWSDGGGVIANQLNYWWGWRDRGGSGLWAQKGNGEVEDVGDTYRTSDITGKLVVTVADSGGIPVDGARVMVLSHWAMEGIDLDVGPYQGPPPVTIPLPSIWGYTDQFGICELTVWRQNFNIRVTSDMGTYVSDKFTVGDSETVEMTVRLDGDMPRHYVNSYEGTSSGMYNLLSAEIVGSCQE